MSFGKNLILVIVAGLITIFLGLKVMKMYTKHGQSITVPPLQGMTIDQVQGVLKNKKLKYVVIDSSFNADLPPGSAVDHQPKAGFKVKQNRKIYLIVNAVNPPLVKLPSLKDNSRRQAHLIIDSWGLNLGKEIYEPDEFLDVVLGVKIGGKIITKDTLIPKGTIVDLILGDGFGGKRVEIPDLLGLRLGEAIMALQLSNLTVGTVYNEEGIRDSINAFVYFQEPIFDGYSTIRMGEAVHLYITSVKP